MVEEKEVEEDANVVWWSMLFELFGLLCFSRARSFSFRITHLTRILEVVGKRVEPLLP